MNTDQVAAVLAALLNSKPEAQPTEPRATDHGLSLVVADRSHVWVGRAVDCSDYTEITDARIVRRWGTTRGLNQLANEGPTGDTELDAPATVKVARRAVIAIIPCEAAAWAGK